MQENTWNIPGGAAMNSVASVKARLKIFLYALYEGDYARATTDIDLRAERISNDVNDMQSVFEDVFSIEADDPLRQSRWNSFVKKKKPLLKISLEDTISVIEGFLGPVADSIVKETDFEGKWSCENKMWL